jgi:methyl-accepting chemotaxis protein
MAKDYDLISRLDALGVSSESRKALARFRPLVDSHIKRSVHEITDTLKRYDPEMITRTSSKGSGRSYLKHMETWAGLSDAELSHAYVESAKALGENRAEIGMDARWHAVGLARLFDGLVRDLITQAWPRWSVGGGSPDQLADQICTVAKLALLDMDLASSAQFEASVDAREQTLARLSETFEIEIARAVQGLSERAHELESTARSMATTTEHASERSTRVAAAAEQATANVSIVAASADEMGKSVAEIAHQVGHSTQIALEAVAKTQTANATLENLAETAEKIGLVVDLISEIASQTNLLALNATIESARAGEAGRGFAVVASEVKNLATQTAKATDDISGQIRAIQAVARESAEAIAAVNAIIEEMNAVSMAINAAVEEQSAATQEIARNTHDAAVGAGEVSRAIGEVQEGAQKAGEASVGVVEGSRDVDAMARGLSEAVQTFLSSLRPAA